MADYYDLLGVDRSASPEDIKRAYRRRAQELHPDRNPDPAAEAQFKELSEAHEVLKDPQKRANYDRFGSAEGPGPSGFGAGGGLGDIFEAFFNMSGSGGAQAANRGLDLEVVTELSLPDAVRGTAKDVTVRTAVACETCDATGAAPGTSVTPCAQCAGSGQVRQVRQSILGQMVTSAPCPRCGGSGQIIPEPCTTCSGEGRRIEDATYTVDIPAGISNGATLRLPGRGAVGSRGGEPGDLYVQISVPPHDVFRRDGDDLHADLRVSMTQAALGAEVAFEAIDDSISVEIPAGSETGDVFRQRSLGAPQLRGRGRGDLLLHLYVETPTELDEAQVELLRQLADARGEVIAPPSSSLFTKIRSAFTG